MSTLKRRRKREVESEEDEDYKPGKIPTSEDSNDEQPRIRPKRQLKKKAKVIDEDSDDDQPLLPTRKLDKKKAKMVDEDSDDDQPLLPTRKLDKGKAPASDTPSLTRKSKKRKFMSQSSSAALRTFDTATVQVAYAASDDEIATNPIHSNVRRVKIWLDNALRTKKYASTNATPAAGASIRGWANQPAVSGRSHVFERCTKTSSGYWEITVLNKSTSNKFFTGDRKYISVADALITGANEGELRNRCHRIAHQLCYLFDRSPIPYPKGSGGTSLVRMLIRLAIEMVYPNEKPRVAWPSVTQRKSNGTTYHITPWFIDPDTYQPVSCMLTIAPSQFVGVNPNRVPDVTETHQFYVQKDHKPIQMDTVDGKTVLPRIVPDDKDLKLVTDRRAHDAATKFICWLATAVQDTVMTVEAVQRFAASSRRMFGAKTKTVHGVYGGFPLFLVSANRTTRQIQMQPSAQLKANFADLDVPTIRISGTMAAADAATALEAGIDAFLNGEDERVAILAAAEEADRISQHKFSYNHARCECTETMALTQGHCCQKCLLFVTCCTRKFSVISACWLCEGCMERQKRSTNDFTDLVQQLLETSLRRSTKEECRAQNIDFDSKDFQTQVYQPALKDIYAYNKSSAGHLAYYNEYLGQNTQFGLNSLSSTPQTPSVDAAFHKWRIVREGKQKYYRHISSNIVVTDSATNRFKFINLPGFLVYSSEFVTRKMSSQEYINKCNELVHIRSKTGFHTGALKDLPLIDDIQWASDLAEMRAGKLAPTLDGHGPVPLKMFERNYAGSFTKGDQKDLANVYKQICEVAGTTPVFSHDGCPWPLGIHDAPMPEEWDWGCGWNLFRERLLRMEGTCNKKWRTYETEKSLFCEVMYQRYMTHDITCEELLGLPLSFYRRHPLKFSIAHRHHGSQMRTGWPLDPKSLEDRDAALNNVIVEAWVTNSMKVDLDEQYYPHLKGIIAGYTVPKRFFDPEMMSQILPQRSNIEPSYKDENDDDLIMECMVGDDLEDDIATHFNNADQQQELEDDAD